ncbi:MAG: protein kinase [Acidobacteria bacterium]|nr:protein kinase [Acidobacteriota bacterium]
MESGIWSLVGAAFHTAMELPVEKRSGFLATLAPEIAEEVAALLDSYEPSAALEPRPLHSAQTGKQYGPYRTTELIGQGGMGTVFRAVREDGEFRQEVALKVIGGHTFDKAAEERFLAERQILARLQHPHIVRLLDGGIAQGQRYFVMELLSGEKITEYCRSRGLAVEGVLRLFLQVGSAIQCAHQNLVIHRDLKPSNIWVTADGIVKVLDFGIAKIVEPELDRREAVTQIRALTLDCASPELVRGEPVTTAADVYSLGLLLYQLLTHVNPQACGDCGLEEALKIICEREAAPVRNVRPELHRDLEAIAMKAMAKKGEQRYASVEQMMDDIARYLEQRPVTARRVTAAYLAGRFVARHKWAVATAVLVAVLVMSGVGAVLWQARKTDRERQLAEKRFNQSRRLIRSMVVDLQEKLKSIPATVAVRKALVEDGVKYLEELSADAVDRPDLLLEIASTYETLGELQGSVSESSLGDFDGADRTYHKGLLLVERLLAANPDHPRAVIEASRLHTNLGFSQSKLMSREKRHEHQVKAAELARKAQMLNPTDRASREFLATSYFHTATARLGQPEELELWSKALEFFQALEKERAGHPNLLRNVALVHKNLAGYWQRKGDPQQSLGHAQRALFIDEELLARNPGDPRAALDVAIDLNALAIALSESGRREDAVPHLRKSIAMRGRLAAQNPQDARYQDRYAFSLLSLGDAMKTSNPKESLQLTSRAVAIWRKLLLSGGPSAVYERFLGQGLAKAGLARKQLGENGCVNFRESWKLLQGVPAEMRRERNVSEDIAVVEREVAGCR